MLRAEIETALDELILQEEGMRFQGLAVVLAKLRWPELIARQRKKDDGLDAYAPASLTNENVGKGLAASITPTLKKVSSDIKTAKKNFPDLGMVLFATPAKVGNAARKQWEALIQSEHSVELHLLEREEIISILMTPEHASLCSNFLHISPPRNPALQELLAKAHRASEAQSRSWIRRTQEKHLMELSMSRKDSGGADTGQFLSLQDVRQELKTGRRIVLEGTAGSGKTTTLIQVALHQDAPSITYVVDLPAWISTGEEILDYVAKSPYFRSEGLTAQDLARLSQTESVAFLLNGWNEVSESNSSRAADAIRVLERNYPSAGIVIATRAHHLTPPLPGSTRLQLMRLSRHQRNTYLVGRLGAQSTQLLDQLALDSSLDALTRIPLVLAEVATLFEAGVQIPSTKLDVLEQVVALHESREEHRAAMQSAPMFWKQAEYLRAFAVEMTRQGSVSIGDAQARAVATSVTRDLVAGGQIEQVSSPSVLSILTSHHILERSDYPAPVLQFAHQQFQEFYAANDAISRLLEISDGDPQAKFDYVATRVDQPAWGEPLRMAAEKIGSNDSNLQFEEAGEKLVNLALDIDPVFAAELAGLCGDRVWQRVRAGVSSRLRSLLTSEIAPFRDCAVAGMLATGAEDFLDVIGPLLSNEKQQTRLSTYRLWPNFQLSVLGSDWEDLVSSWGVDARIDFVSELLHEQINDRVVDFAVGDRSEAVKAAAASGLLWTHSDRDLLRVTEAMEDGSFLTLSLRYLREFPNELKPKGVAAIRKFLHESSDPRRQISAIVELIQEGEIVEDRLIQEVLAATPKEQLRELDEFYVRPLMEFLHRSDPAWLGSWVATHLIEGTFHVREQWLAYVDRAPDDTIESFFQQLASVDFGNSRYLGLVAVVASRAYVDLVARAFIELRDIKSRIDAAERHALIAEERIFRQLEELVRECDINVAMSGFLAVARTEDLIDVAVGTDVFSLVGRTEGKSLRLLDDELRESFREYLIRHLGSVLALPDVTGERKAAMASCIAQVGVAQDAALLEDIIREDVERMRRGRIARESGNRGLVANGAMMNYARWNIDAVRSLESDEAERLLIQLLAVPEYQRDVAQAIVAEFTSSGDRSFSPASRYERIWEARLGPSAPSNADSKPARFAAALRAELSESLNQEANQPTHQLRSIASALAVVDGLNSAGIVVESIERPGPWDQLGRLEAAERLVWSGGKLPAEVLSSLIDSIRDRTGLQLHDSDWPFLRRALCLCPFVSPPQAGISKLLDVLAASGIPKYEFGPIVTALGQARDAAAADVLIQWSADPNVIERCACEMFEALLALKSEDGDRALLRFVSPDADDPPQLDGGYVVDALVSALTMLANRNSEAAGRLEAFCRSEISGARRELLSRVMSGLDTPGAAAANVGLVDDTSPQPVPRGVWDQLRRIFIEQRQLRDSSNSFELHPQSSNELRSQLYGLLKDGRRRQSALRLLGWIEEWRLELGKPNDEPRHPDINSGRSWPPTT